MSSKVMKKKGCYLTSGKELVPENRESNFNNLRSRCYYGYRISHFVKNHHLRGNTGHPNSINHNNKDLPTAVGKWWFHGPGTAGKMDANRHFAGRQNKNN